MLPPIDRNSRIHALAGVIRRAVAEKRPAPAQGRQSSEKPHKQEEALAPIIERARKISPSHPRRPQQALRLFIEGILLDEFGKHLSTDMAFQNLVDDIARVLEESEHYGPDCVRLGQLLLSDEPIKE
jgi:hypothetical protein